MELAVFNFPQYLAQHSQPQFGIGGRQFEAVEKTAHVQSLEDQLRQKLAVRVEIRLKEKDKGQVVLGFESNDDFERLLEVLNK